MLIKSAHDPFETLKTSKRFYLNHLNSKAFLAGLSASVSRSDLRVHATGLHRGGHNVQVCEDPQ